MHISADGECRITNRGNVTRVLLNDIPLERGRRVELQDGDVLGIDDYQIEVSALQQHAALQAQPVAKAAAVAAAAACSRRQRKIRRAHPQRNLGQPGGRIYAECAGRRHAAAGRQSVQPPAAGHPARELNLADPLAQLAGDVDLRQPQQQQPIRRRCSTPTPPLSANTFWPIPPPARCWRNRLRQRGRQLRLRMRGNRSKSWIRWRCSAVHPLPRRPKR